MWIQELEAFSYRNFENLKVQLGPGINLFLGHNGQGKTNILEAIFVLSYGYSFRTADLSPLIKKESLNDGFQIRAKLSTKFDSGNYEANLGEELSFIFDQQKRRTLINKKKASQSDLLEMCPLVLFSPESLNAVKQGPETRRRLVDEMMSLHNPFCISLLRNYKRALQSRNRLLQDYKKGVSSERQTLDLIDAIDHQFMPLAVEVTKQRLLSLQAILPLMEQIFCEIQKQSVEILVDYVVSGQNALAWNEQKIHDALHKRRAELLSAELQNGSSLIGPHKHDIRFLTDGTDARIFCSQGQQRSLILSFKIAQIMYHKRSRGEDPLLLLDDVFSELDVEKQSYLVDYLDRVDAQIIMSSTDWKTQTLSKQPTVFSVQNAEVKQEGGGWSLNAWQTNNL